MNRFLCCENIPRIPKNPGDNDSDNSVFFVYADSAAVSAEASFAMAMRKSRCAGQAASAKGFFFCENAIIREWQISVQRDPDIILWPFIRG